ncbi:MAG: DNA adenine methylase [Flavipsychrobacter sp.]
MKPALTYYGGKQKLVPVIIPLIPEHKLYSEPFAGGAAILFAKPPSEMEVLNDTNKELVNFYKIVQQDYLSLEKKIRITLHSRSQHKDARVIYENPHLFSDLDRAWAVWVLASQSFSSMLDGAWGYDKTRNTATKKIINKGIQFTEEYAIRLQNVQIECADAIYIIQSRDSVEAFHYCDPPYFNSDCGHYKGYTEADMVRLLETLASVKGKFLLSSYPSELLAKYTQQYGWLTKTIQSKTSVNKGSGKMKTEVLTANYAI